MEYPAFFGETLPVISRAVGGDDEDDVHVDTDCTLLWSPQTKAEINQSIDKCLDCAMVVITVGKEATGFAETYLLHDDDMTELLGVMIPGTSEETFETWCVPKLADKRCSIRRMKQQPRVLVVTCSCPITQYQSASWTNQLFGSITLKDLHVMVLNTDLTTNYRREVCLDNDLDVPFLRSLNTSSHKNTPCAPYLEQPNVVSGLPAQILTMMQVRHVAAVLYNCYKDIGSFDINSTKLFRKVLQSTPMKEYLVDNPKADRRLVELVEIHKDRSTLYI